MRKVWGSTLQKMLNVPNCTGYLVRVFYPVATMENRILHGTYTIFVFERSV